MTFSIVLLALSTPAVRVQTITVSFPGTVSSKPLDGRVLFLLSNNPSDEPRMQIDDTPRSQMIFGTTVDGLKPGETVRIDGNAAGYPIRSIKNHIAEARIRLIHSNCMHEFLYVVMSPNTR